MQIFKGITGGVEELIKELDEPALALSTLAYNQSWMEERSDLWVHKEEFTKLAFDELDMSGSLVPLMETGFTADESKIICESMINGELLGFNKAQTIIKDLKPYMADVVGNINSNKAVFRHVENSVRMLTHILTGKRVVGWNGYSIVLFSERKEYAI